MLKTFSYKNFFERNDEKNNQNFENKKHVRSTSDLACLFRRTCDDTYQEKKISKIFKKKKFLKKIQKIQKKNFLKKILKNKIQKMR